ncbi:putative transmembrane protein 32 protein [Golovinomyces cichoracearum]|uniref:Putative transmembrane protein 32 protein n=1 Tax=Golovinomyces cichoracearum TaxID=62708 RepID=A0A420ITZ8_9PEZI|nr:putative transmembrane protein 32 protein [Golovinomyces cichoracearum]
MTWAAKFCISVGLLSLAHACYSAHEYSILHSVSTASINQISREAFVASNLSSPPNDISVETIIAIILTCLGLVLNTPELQPIQWRVWAGKIERESDQCFVNSDGLLAKDTFSNPFKALENRPGFVDIRKQRREFLEWAKKTEAELETSEKK